MEQCTNDKETLINIKTIINEVLDAAIANPEKQEDLTLLIGIGRKNEGAGRMEYNQAIYGSPRNLLPILAKMGADKRLAPGFIMGMMQGSPLEEATPNVVH